MILNLYIANHEWINIVNIRIELIRDDYFFFLYYLWFFKACVYNLKCKYSIDKNINIHKINSDVL